MWKKDLIDKQIPTEVSPKPGKLTKKTKKKGMKTLLTIPIPFLKKEMVFLVVVRFTLLFTVYCNKNPSFFLTILVLFYLSRGKFSASTKNQVHLLTIHPYNRHTIVTKDKKISSVFRSENTLERVKKSRNRVWLRKTLRCSVIP